MSAPVANAAGGAAPSWKLAPDVARDTQAFVISGFTDLPAAHALFLHADEKGGGWLGRLRAVAPITASDGKRTPSYALAFTRSGLDQLVAGQPSIGDVMADFGTPFVEGMSQADRRRRLGDADATLAWSGNAPGAEAAPETVHALLLIYDTSHEALLAHLEPIRDALGEVGVRVVRTQHLDLRLDARGIAREHFGFADGISQPIPYGEGTAGSGADGTWPRDPIHGVPLGDILLGYPDAYGRRSAGPCLPVTKKSGAPLLAASRQEATTSATQHPDDAGLRDIGRNGSYLVVRELRQDYDGFWGSLERAAADLNARYPGKPAVDAQWLAARVVGRTLDGDMLTNAEPLPPLADGTPDNDFLFYLRDLLGPGCPMGSHVRRANPRDGLSFKPEACADLLVSANAHRILRRGRKIGGDVGPKPDAETPGTKTPGADTHDAETPDADTPDKAERGLMFMCLNTDIERQFEFVQQNWMLNPNFATLFDEIDPLVGPASPMTLPDRPARRRIEVDQYVTLVGGEYFFLPSLTALDILAKL